MSDLSLCEIVDRLLAEENNAVLAGRMTADVFTRRWAARAATAPTVPGRPTLTAFGMVQASVERHLADAGAVGPRVPAAGAATLARWADGGPLREVLADYVAGPDFLGGAAELAFKANVITIGAAYRRAHEAVEPLLDPAGWDRVDVVERLDLARAQFELANATHRTQARAPVEDRRDFADRVRGFYRPRTVAGVAYEGINAAHEPDVASMDVVLGCDDHRYRLYLQHAVRPHLLRVDRRRFDSRLAGGSLRGALSERLGVRDVVTDPLDLAGHGWRREAVVAYAAVLKAHAAVSNAHRGVIRAVLEQRLHEPDIARGIDVTRGSGGRPHDETDALRAMRHRSSRTLLYQLRAPGAGKDHS